MNLKFVTKRCFNRVTMKGFITQPDDVVLINEQLLNSAEDDEVTFLLWNRLAKCSENIDLWEELIAEDSMRDFNPANRTT